MKSRVKLVKGKVRSDKGIVKKVNTTQEFKHLLKDVEVQKAAIIWNREFVGKKRRNGQNLIEELKKVQLTNNCMIVQLYREYPIAEDKIIFNEEGKISSWVCMPALIDARAHSTHKENWELNPIPTISKGIIVAISPELQLDYVKKKKELEENGIDVTNYMVPEVGDTVYTNHFMTKNMRYYIDKQEALKDIVVTPTDYTLEKFDFIFKITGYEIESIVKRDCVDKVVDNDHKYADLFLSLNEDNLHEHYIINEYETNENI